MVLKYCRFRRHESWAGSEFAMGKLEMAMCSMAADVTTWWKRIQKMFLWIC